MGFLRKILGGRNKAQVEIDEFVANIDTRNATSDDADHLCNAANKLLRNGQLANAIELYKKVIQINPQHDIATSNLGSAYIESNQITMAITTLKKATEINPAYANAWHNLGNAYFRSSQKDKAVEAYQQAIRIEPNHVSANHNIKLCR